MKHWLREYFNLSTGERAGFISLIILIVLLTFAPALYRMFFPPDYHHLTFLEKQMRVKTTNADPTPSEVELFDFDPNTASKEEFLALGLEEYVADIILKYRNAGGQFYQRDDLLNIYSITKEEYLRLRPHIRIQRDNNYGSRYASATFSSQQLHIDLNTTTPEELRQIRGIGEVLSERIVKYRDSKGGFHSKDELLEVYGISEELFQSISDQVYTSEIELPVKLVAEAGYNPKKEEKMLIDLNSAGAEQLQQIRGVGPVFSQRIVEYRDKLGGFTSKEQLLEIYGIEEEQFDLIHTQVKIDMKSVKRVNINTIPEKELRQHPYITKQIAEQIIKYRSHKEFAHPEEIKQLMLVDDAVFKKLAPYITTD